MAWMKTLADFDYKPKPGVTIAYRANCEYNAPRAAVTLAVAAGKATRLRKIGKEAAPMTEGDGG